MRYCCYVRNVLAEMGIKSEQRWYEAATVVEAAMAYYLDVGVFPTDVSSENPDQKERASVWYAPPAALEADLAKVRAELTSAYAQRDEMRKQRDEIQKQRDNFLAQREEAIRQNEEIYTLANKHINNLFHAAKTALVETGKVMRGGVYEN